MRTKTITAATEKGFNTKINNFLELSEKKGNEIIEIQFAFSFGTMAAMIIYKEKR